MKTRYAETLFKLALYVETIMPSYRGKDIEGDT
jgi:hypothetical protein